MKEHVTKSNLNGYERRNINFMVWLFYNHMKYSNVPKQSFCGMLLSSNEIDNTQWKINEEILDVPIFHTKCLTIYTLGDRSGRRGKNTYEVETIELQFLQIIKHFK